MAQQNYTVAKHFVYSGTAYAPGDGWRPAGHRVDKLLLQQRFVVETEAPPPAEAAPETAVTQPMRRRGREVSSDARV